MARTVRPANSPIVAPTGHAETVEALEQRVRRLEDAVAALQDTQTHGGPRRRAGRAARGSCATSNGRRCRRPDRQRARMLLPKPADDARRRRGRRPDAPTTTARPPSPRSRPIRLAADGRCPASCGRCVRMFTDYRYRMSWTGRVVPLAAHRGRASLSWLLIQRPSARRRRARSAVDLVLVVVVYKALSREVRSATATCCARQPLPLQRRA